MAWFKVISYVPLVLNHGNGAVQSLPRGTSFEADENLPDVRKYLKMSPPKIAPCAPDPNGVKAPGPSYPIPGPAKPEPPKKPLPGGVSEVVKSPALLAAEEQK